MNQYLLFAGADYYPQGGVDDFVQRLEANNADDIPDRLIGQAIATRAVEQGQEKGYFMQPEWAHLALLSDTGLSVVRRWTVRAESREMGVEERPAESIRFQRDPDFDDDWTTMWLVPRAD